MYHHYISPQSGSKPLVYNMLHIDQEDNHRQKRKIILSWKGCYTIGLLLFIGTPSAAFLQNERQCRQVFLSKSPTYDARLWSTDTASDTASYTDEIQQKLESLTVKDLRQMLKESHLNRRGILSQLKLKKELVEFLNKNLDPSLILGHSPRAGSSIAESKPKDTPKEEVNGTKRGINPSLSMPSCSSTNAHLSGPLSPAKEAIFKKVYLQYPPLKAQNCTGVGEDDIRQTHHPMFSDGSSQLTGDMDITFVGTASCTPGTTRGVSCTALRLNWNRRPIHGVPGVTDPLDATSFTGGTWLFDCGECTQLQVQKTGVIKPGKINKIFLTHAHGDHSFGLPGLLCLMGQDRDRHTSAPIDIYGPEGLRMWLRVAIRYSVSRIVPNYRVHELKDIPIAPEWELSRRVNRYFYRGLNHNGAKSRGWGYQGLAGEDPSSWISQAGMMQLKPLRLYGELEGGRDIYPIYDHPSGSDGAPVWEVEDEEDVRVFAAPMSHSVPCVGYVVEEQSKPGRLRDEIVTPMVKRNLEALKEAGFRIPMKALAVIKSLPIGSAFSFPDGTVITQEEAVEPPRRGRKVVICGDTASSRAIEALAMDADVVVHEATNSFLAGIDKDTNLRDVTREAILHGHSTPFMAGEFAKQVRAQTLVLNHFSARYKGDQSVDSISIMTRIEGQAIKSSGLDSNRVAAAWDFMVLPVRQEKEQISNSEL